MSTATAQREDRVRAVYERIKQDSTSDSADEIREHLRREEIAIQRAQAAGSASGTEETAE
ncbi:MAG: hypothetical protein ACLQVD_15735 [Capsulimonadaceae bacterium]